MAAAWRPCAAASAWISFSKFGAVDQAGAEPASRPDHLPVDPSGFGREPAEGPDGGEQGGRGLVGRHDGLLGGPEGAIELIDPGHFIALGQ